MITPEGYELVFQRGFPTENASEIFSLISRPENLRPTEVKSVEQETFLESDPLEIKGYAIKSKVNLKGHKITLWDSVDIKGNLLASSAMVITKDMRYDTTYERDIDSEDYRYSIMDLTTKDPKKMLEDKLRIVFRRENKNLLELSELNPRSKNIVNYNIPSECNYGHDFSFFKIKGDLYGSDVKIRGRLDLMFTKVEGNLYLSRAKMDYVCLEGVKVKKDAFLDDLDIKNESLSWDEMHVEGDVDFRNLKADSLSLREGKFLGHVDFSGMHVRDLYLDDVIINSCKLEGLKVDDYLRVNKNTKIPENLRAYLEEMKKNPSFQKAEDFWNSFDKSFEEEFGLVDKHDD